MRTLILLLAVAAVGYAGKPSNTTDNSLSATGKLAKRQVDAANHGLGAQSGGCVNEPDCPAATLTASNLQSETSIAMDSTGQHVVVAFNDFRGFGTTVSVSGFAYSDDGGVTFVDGGQLPVGPTTMIGAQRFPQI